MSGRWDQTAFVRQIRAHFFPLIVTTDVEADQAFTPEVRDAIRESYRLIELVGGWQVFRPN
jgi:hypothetical protein